MKAYVIINNQMATLNVAYLFNQVEIFAKVEAARARLKEMGTERKTRLGVRHWEEYEDSFSFVLGWESAHVKFSIIEIEVKE